MTNLPIAHHPPQSSGNNTNALQLATSADDQTARGSQRTGGAPVDGACSTQSKVAEELPGVGEPTAGVSEPFSELLARQMSEADSRTLITVQDNIAIEINAAAGDADSTAAQTQYQTAIVTNDSGNPASILATMLLQIPASEDRGRKTGEGSSAPLTAEGSLRSSGENTGVPLAGARESGAVRLMAEGSFQQAAGRLPLAESQFPMTASSQQPDPAGLIPLSTEVLEHAKMADNSAKPPQTSTPQAITPPALSAVMTNTLSHNAVNATQTITTPLGSNVWAEEFTQKISWMCTQQNQVAELHLNPPDLGPLDVVLKISGNQATVLFTSPHGAVRDAVENALPKLREILADNGIMLGNATVSDQSHQDRSADGNINHGFGTAAQRAILDEASNSTGLSTANSQTGPTRRHNGMVDTFA